MVGLLGLVVVAVAPVAGTIGIVASCCLVLAVVVATAIATGGLVCLWRDKKIQSGTPDPVGLSLNAIPSGGFWATMGLRPLLGPAPRPGDLVEIRSLSEIRSTLDADSALDGLPFMSEMSAYCGHTFRVHRCVDKIYDMRHKTGMRRLSDTLSLAAVRCDGASHDGCQAGCQLLWKNAWLRRLPAGTKDELITAVVGSAVSEGSTVASDRYICQMTRLWEASEPMSRFDVRQDMRPLIWGNVSPGTFFLVVLTRLFNAFQLFRSGIEFPFMPDRLSVDLPAVATLPSLAPGQDVVVQDRVHICQTLVNNKTKGLWYDRDMVRYCGNASVVERGVDHLIHEGTGEMVTIKTPCWILRNMTATGEFHRLCPQHEHIFWREAWLRLPPAPNKSPIGTKDLGYDR